MQQTCNHSRNRKNAKPGKESQSVNTREVKKRSMAISYKKLWKLLIDKNMIKKDLRLAAGLSTNVIAKLGKNENVSTEVLGKICKVLNCEITDIMEFVDEDNK